LYRASFEEDTLLLADLNSRMESVSYYVQCDFDSTIMNELKNHRVYWPAHQYYWEFQKSTSYGDEDCIFPDNISLDLRKGSQGTYIFEGNQLLYLISGDTIKFSHLSSTDSTLVLSQHCSVFGTFNACTFKKRK
jgi:hypothetical protein